MVPTLHAISALFVLALPCVEADGTVVPQIGAPRSTEQPVLSTEARVIAGCLRASRTNPSAASELAARIVASGPGALTAMFDILVECRIARITDLDAPQVLSVPQRAILLDALRRMPLEAVRAHVSACLRAARADDDAVNLAVIHALGAVGSAGDLQRIVALAPRKHKNEGDDASWTRAAREAVRPAVESILARDSRGWTVLPGIVRTTDHIAARTLLEALGTRRDPRALAVLLESLHAHPGLAPLAVASATKVGASLDAAITEEFVAWMCDQLVDARREHAQGLLQAIGALDDGSHTPVLIDALDDEDVEVREAAARGLQRLTGFGFPSTPAPWRAWWDEEVRWNETERESAREDLGSDDPAIVVAALREYAGHRAWRDSLAEDVLLAVQNAEPNLRAVAFEVLEKLHASAAIRPMVSLLEAPESDVRGAARRALVSISGLDVLEDSRSALALLNML